MPTIFRFLMSLAVIATVIAVIVFALGNFVEPNTRSMTIRLPPGRLEPRPVTPPPAPAPPSVAVEGDALAGTESAGP